VRTGVDLLETERRLKARPRRLRVSARAAAAVAAAILLSTGWGILRSRTGSAAFAAGGAPERHASPVPEPASAVQPAGLASADAPPASSDATIYDWNPGAGREEPRVVWIVDRGLDI
jgi:hypothetical protein